MGRALPPLARLTLLVDQLRHRAENSRRRVRVGYPKREISFVAQPSSTTVTAPGRVEVHVEMSKNCYMFTRTRRHETGKSIVVDGGGFCVVHVPSFLPVHRDHHRR